MKRILTVTFVVGIVLIYSSAQLFSQSSDQLSKYLHGESSKKWKTVGFYIQGISGFQECRLDDTFILSKDGTYKYDGGKRLFGGEDNKRNKTGFWEIAKGEKALIFNKGKSNEYIGDIVSSEDGFLIVTTTYGGLEVKGVYQVK